MPEAAVFNPNTARWLVNLGKKLEASQILNPGHIERLVLKVMPRFSVNDDAIRYAYPPSGGIPAASYDTSTKVLTPGTANCTLAQYNDGQYDDDTGSTVMVENPVGSIVGASGKPLTIGRTAYGKWTVLVEDCSSTSGGPVVGVSVLTADSADFGGSRSIDLGYTMGV